MSRVTQAQKEEQIKLAAFAFAHFTRDANEIAKALEVSPRTIQRLIHNEAFHAELDRWNYQGDRNFRVKPARDRTRSEDYEKAKRLWFEMSDVPEHRRTREIAKQVDTDYHTLRIWTRDWRTKGDVTPDSDD